MPPSTATSANQANERTLVTRILITGSAQGLGRAATTLLDDGHQVVVHARDTSRTAASSKTDSSSSWPR